MEAKKLQSTYSYYDYLTWNESERWELLDGVAYAQATPTGKHQEISGEICTQIDLYLRGKKCKVYSAPFTVRLDKFKSSKEVKNVVEPDITVVCDKSKLDARGCIGAPDMIVEIVSPSSYQRDKVTKLNKYEMAGVREYWIVEPELELVNVYILNNDSKYDEPEIYTKDDKVKVSIFQDLEIDLKFVFNKEEYQNIPDERTILIKNLINQGVSDEVISRSFNLDIDIIKNLK